MRRVMGDWGDQSDIYDYERDPVECIYKKLIRDMDMAEEDSENEENGGMVNNDVE